ncbi:MAG TPA: radical SAM protein [Alphaproteobacteria bacterium]|jgi:coproporphyrinogen III oxidase-like Fe-S oxidoreductase|nr:radical SAM protein [Alphaproteobacteria bacterium]MDP6270952.1 radical SAM protein [Alphaproteobacteria bacterium]HJM48877.1 radical SAM protein [Alphaproteobacteria bacterium]|tara:strand:+ start:720 stop:1601 length:882 start_codon:yes stop_codon:yes gene_type:complete
MPVTYDMPLYRPPSEGPNLIIQATLGCSFNRCTFCSMYRTKTYVEREPDQVFADIDTAAADWPQAHRVFLADGDALGLDCGRLHAILDHLGEHFRDLARVSVYATPKNLLDKSVDELAALKRAGLSLVYLGIESGATPILKKIRKGASQKTLAQALERAFEAGLKVSATVILGLGGRADWRQHIEGTAELVNQAPPTYLSTLELGLEEGAAADFMAAQKAPFEFQDDAAILAEQALLLSLLEPSRPVIFRSNHASNSLALAGNLPRDRERLLAELGAAMAGAIPLRPRFLRGF